MKSFTAILFLAAAGAIADLPSDKAPALRDIVELGKRKIAQLDKRSCDFIDPCWDSETNCRSSSICDDKLCTDPFNGIACAGGCAVACPATPDCNSCR